MSNKREWWKNILNIDDWKYISIGHLLFATLLCSAFMEKCFLTTFLLLKGVFRQFFSLEVSFGVFLRAPYLIDGFLILFLAISKNEEEKSSKSSRFAKEWSVVLCILKILLCSTISEAFEGIYLDWIVQAILICHVIFRLSNWENSKLWNFPICDDEVKHSFNKILVIMSIMIFAYIIIAIGLVGSFLVFFISKISIILANCISSVTFFAMLKVLCQYTNFYNDIYFMVYHNKEEMEKMPEDDTKLYLADGIDLYDKREKKGNREFDVILELDDDEVEPEEREE